MEFNNPTREEIGQLLRKAGNIAVVGLSDKSDRTSYMVAEAMQSRGYRIIPVNPQVQGEILGETVYATLADIPEPVDIVNVFRREEFCADVVATPPPSKQMYCGHSLGIHSDEAVQIAAENGMTAVTNRCIKVEDSIVLRGAGRG